MITDKMNYFLNAFDELLNSIKDFHDWNDYNIMSERDASDLRFIALDASDLRKEFEEMFYFNKDKNRWEEKNPLF